MERAERGFQLSSRLLAFLFSGLLGAAAAGTVGCATPPAATVPQLLRRATVDLQCPYSYVTIVPLDRLTKVASGCGRHLVYLELCQPVTEGYACTWRVDANPYAAPPAQIAPASYPSVAHAPSASPAPCPVPSPPPASSCRPTPPSAYSPSEL
jgi:hypothetical protein